MRIGAKFFVLLSLSLGQCIGAPPRQGSTKSTKRTAYTHQEDAFIVEQLTSLPEEYTKIFGKGLWERIAEKHREKWQQGTPGFPKERSVQSLFGRFKDTLIYNHPKANVKLPVTFLQKIADQRNQKKLKGVKATYNPEERQLIFEELLKPSSITLHGAKTWEAILAEHNKRRLVDKHPAFQHERSSEGLRSHILCDKKQRDNLPDEIVKKFGIPPKGASSSNPPNQQTDLQVTNEEQGEDELIADMIEELLNDNNYEIDFSRLEPEYI